METIFIDPQGYSGTTTVFNNKKFYQGRAIRIDGIDGEGDPINGNYLIKSVEHDRMCAVDFNNNEVTVYIGWLLSEFDHSENETYDPSIFIELYGEDLA